MSEIWILWGCLAGFVIFYGLRALKNTTNIFSPPLIISLLVFGILVTSYFEFDDITIADFLDTDYYIVTMEYTVLCLLAFCFFYEKGLRSKKTICRHQELSDKLPSGLLSLYVTFIVVIGFTAQVIFADKSGGLVAFYSQPHGIAGKYLTTSAYLSALPNFLWSALLIAYVVWLKGGHGSKYFLFLVIVIGAALFAHTFLFGNRNGIIRFSIILGGAYVFTHRPSIVQSLPLIGLLLMAAVSILVIPSLRGSLHLGSDIPIYVAIDKYFDDNFNSIGERTLTVDGGGHELFFNVAVLQAASETGDHDYGAQYIFPFISFVPRSLWPDKPHEDKFVLDYFALSERVTGWSAGRGSAPSAIGLSFLAFSWLGFIPWGIFGFYCGRAVGTARDAPTLMNIGFLISALLASVYWVTQSFNSVFFAWFYMIAPFYGLRVIAKLNRSVVPRLRRLDRVQTRNS